MTGSVSPRKDVWTAGDLYEPYVGRWSRLVARELLTWLQIPPHKDWLDVGCGTGALTEVILQQAQPRSVKGIDPSVGFIEHARAHIRSSVASFEVGDAHSLPPGAKEFDVAVAGLMLNFVPQPSRALAEMVRAVREGATVAAYVWDPSAVDARSIDVPTRFRDFDDYWSPFLGGQGPAPAYAMSLSDARRDALRDRIRASLPIAQDGSIALIARAWAVRGHASP